MKKGKSSREGKNWYADRYQSVRVQRDLLSLITLGAVAVAFVAVSLVYVNIPLVTVEPFVIQVDKKSGITQAVTPDTVEELTAHQVVNQYFVVNYIRARETISSNLLYNYNIVRIMSDPIKVFGEYKWWVNANNEEGVVATLGPEGWREIEIKSVIFIDEKQVQVRATVREGTRPGERSKVMHKVIYMQFDYVDLELSLAERYFNPLGFLVSSYRMEEEAM